MASLVILGLVATAVAGPLMAQHYRESEALALVQKSNRMLVQSKKLYRASCREPGFHISLNVLKQKQLLDGAFTFPQHQISITAPQSSAARIHLEITLSRALMTAFLEAHPKAQKLSDDTVLITEPASSHAMPGRKRLLSMKALWGESSC